MVDPEELQRRLGVSLQESRFRHNRRLDVTADRVFDLLRLLFGEYGFSMLVDVTAVDYLEYPAAVDRFRVIYQLLNVDSGERLVVRTPLNPPELQLSSVVSVWPGANWLEREIYDMFGIVFTGHPDLRRILMPDEFTEYPLRKDYPVKGRGERHNFPVITRAES